MERLRMVRRENQTVNKVQMVIASQSMMKGMSHTEFVMGIVMSTLRVGDRGVQRVLVCGDWAWGKLI